MLCLLKRIVAGFVATAAVGSIGCASADTGPVGVAESAIIGGHESGAEDDAVVRIETPDAGCTGTLVAANLLVTARHCVSHTTPGAFDCALDGTLMTGGPEGELGTDIDPTTVRVFVGANLANAPAAYGKEIHSTETPVICEDDLAFVVLDRDLSAPIRPLRTIALTTVDELMSIIGFGASATDAGTEVQRMRIDGKPVLAVGPDDLANGPGDAPPRQFAVGESTCYGDSGGPAIAPTGAVAGVYSLLAGSACDSPSVRNYFVEIRPYASLVRAAFGAAGAEVWVEGAARPGTQECVGDCVAAGCAFSRSTEVSGDPWIAVFVLFGFASAARCARRARRTCPDA